MSAASATSSVIAVEGVSGEMATPAFILRSCMALMRDNGSAGLIDVDMKGERCIVVVDVIRTGCLEVEAVEGTARICDVIHPLLVVDSESPVRALGIGGMYRTTFSGCATIMWQSIKMPGTPLDTQDRMGAPVRLHENGWLVAKKREMAHPL